MVLSVTKGDGVTVITVKSDPQSNCPLVCQFLGALCYSPVCAVSQRLRIHLGGAQAILGTIHIVLGLLSICLGLVLFTPSWVIHYLRWVFVPYWLGGTFIATGIICILTERFPSLCMAFLSAFINVVSCTLAVAAIVLYSVDLAMGQDLQYVCNWTMKEQRSYGWWTTISPEAVSAKMAEFQKDLDLCKNEKHLVMMLQGGLEILLIILAVIQLCCAISASVMSIKALCRNCRGKKKDPEPYEPFMEEVSTNPHD